MRTFLSGARRTQVLLFVTTLGNLVEAQSVRTPAGFVSIGSLDGEHDAFATLTDVLLLGNGLTLVLDRLEHRVVAFDSTGRFRWQYGRAGSGPGEFRWPAKLISLSDSAFGVVDVARGRVIELIGKPSSGSFASERPGPIGGMFMCAGAGRLAVARASAGGESITTVDLVGQTRDSVSALDLSAFGAGADDVASSSPVGCALAGNAWLQVNGSSGQLAFVDRARKRRLVSQLSNFSGFSVKPAGKGITEITTPLDRHSAPWQVLTLPSGFFVIPVQDRRTTGLNRARTAPVFETLATYVYLVSAADSLSTLRVATPGVVRALRRGVAAMEASGEYPRILVGPAPWAK